MGTWKAESALRCKSMQYPCTHEDTAELNQPCVVNPCNVRVHMGTWKAESALRCKSHTAFVHRGHSRVESVSMLDRVFQGLKKQILQAYNEEPGLPVEPPADRAPPRYVLGMSGEGWKMISKEHLRRWIRV